MRVVTHRPRICTCSGDVLAGDAPVSCELRAAGSWAWKEMGTGSQTKAWEENAEGSGRRLDDKGSREMTSTEGGGDRMLRIKGRLGTEEAGS